MSLRSMTGFAQVRGQVHAGPAFVLSLKSVNHRFLDLHFRLPSDADALEMALRRALKEKLARGHIEVGLNVDGPEQNGSGLNRELIAGYVRAFRAAAGEFGLQGEPDLNVVLRMPGAMDSGTEVPKEELQSAVMASVDEVLGLLNRMREEEGRGIERELRERTKHLRLAASGVEAHRSTILHAYSERLQSRMREMLGAQVDKDRILQEAAVLVDRSDIQEELVRLNADFARDLIGADRCSLWLIDVAKNELWTKVADGVAPLHIPMGAGLIGACVRDNQVLLVNNAAEESRLLRKVDASSGYRTEQVLCVPLRAERRKNSTDIVGLPEMPPRMCVERRKELQQIHPDAPGEW